MLLYKQFWVTNKVSIESTFRSEKFLTIAKNNVLYVILGDTWLGKFIASH